MKKLTELQLSIGERRKWQRVSHPWPPILAYTYALENEARQAEAGHNDSPATHGITTEARKFLTYCLIRNLNRTRVHKFKSRPMTQGVFKRKYIARNCTYLLLSTGDLYKHLTASLIHWIIWFQTAWQCLIINTCIGRHIYYAGSHRRAGAVRVPGWKRFRINHCALQKVKLLLIRRVAIHKRMQHRVYEVFLFDWANLL